MSSFLKNLGVFLAAVAILALVAGGLQSQKEEIKTIGLSELAIAIQKKEIKNIEVQNSDLNIEKNDGTKEYARKEDGESISTVLKNYGVVPEDLQKVNIIVATESGWHYWLSLLVPTLVPVILIGLIFYFMARQVQGANNKALGFGQSMARQAEVNENTSVRFADVAGMKEPKEELQEIVEFLRDQKRFTDMGAKIPKGVLLMGPPGTGKTLLAKAVAGEAGVPFFHISGSEFVEMFVGVGASRVRDLFRQAKKSAPAILFIDEIDAVGRRRGAGLGGSHDEREQTLNQILVEMDGFEPNLGIIVVAATNRPDVLDPALLRPGRFDRRVTISPPDINEREAILQIHAKNKPLVPEISLRNIAERTPGFTGADLANLLNEAAILAVRRTKTTVELSEILESVDKVILGPERRSRVISPEERRITAYHEAGHALVAHLLPHTDPIRKISIIARGHAGGYTLKMPAADKSFHTRAEFRDELAMILGGFVAEKLIFGDDMISTGPSSDLRAATRLAKDIVTVYGMSDELGPRTFGEHEEFIFLGRDINEQRDYSEKTAERIDAEVRRLIEEARERAVGLLTRYREKLDVIAGELLEKENVEEQEFLSLVGIPKGEEVGV